MSDEHDGREVVEEIITPAGRQARAREYQQSSVDGVEITEKFRAFLRQVVDGKLPDLGDVPELDPLVAELAAELLVVHLPEWRNPAGRVLAGPTTVPIPQAPRLAAYLIDRGWVHDPSRERVRWIPTPGGPPGPHDQGLHIHPDENGQWPAPDPEVFYDVADIRVDQLDDGTWAARHPRDIAYQAPTKSEAYEGIVARLRAKIEEAKTNA
ncbi:hypothetical protein [Nocardia cyriacigeorgica]|uniref:hypothetical protein n=1 Tax=Nocardia cyriacigeorgica TaxID=135487 RepID=UPI001892D860|nr:hypothetical protein [Nocardia cyriacigeorgica]MBF6288480.1 hypothetical protein [Nocardia cyriacigeorgica]